MRTRSSNAQKVDSRRSERLKIITDENIQQSERKRRTETVKSKFKGNNVNVNDSQQVKKRPKRAVNSNFIGVAIDMVDAMRRWPHRYELDNFKGKCTRPMNQTDDGISRERGKEDKVVAECIAHYTMADVDGIIYELGDCVHLNSDSGPDYIGRILEFFQTNNQQCWFSAQWFYYLNDTAIGKHEAKGHDKRRVFLSTMKDDNFLECITAKLKVIHVPALTRFICKHESIPPCNYYYDMGYDYAFSTFKSLLDDTEPASSDSTSTTSINNGPNLLIDKVSDISSGKGRSVVVNSELSLLDLYCGCGAMSTGLCMGTNLSGVKLITRWAVDLNSYACESMKYNHPETKVRNEMAEDFLHLVKEWKKLCEKYIDSRDYKKSATTEIDKHNSCSYKKSEDDSHVDEEFEVEKIMDIRYVDSSLSKLSGIQFKVRWKGYGEDEDTWEPYESLMKCEECVKDFVTLGIRKRILPLPGDVDVICGGPPCQGATGLNRFRNVAAPLDDPQNYQIVVFMDIVDFLRPRFVLMENVVDILKFAGGILGRYALNRLVKMHYQARLGMMVAGCYGIPQFRMRVFLWGASPLEILPPYPLPTHDVVIKGSFPVSWEHNAVAYDEIDKPQLREALVLADAISDLPPVKNSEDRDWMPYNRSCHSDFQYLVRLPKEAFNGGNSSGSKRSRNKLFDHRPYMLNEDDFERTCKIPKQKGANFRDLEGVIVRSDNSVELDLENRVLLASGKPLVPDYAVSLLQGHSLRPFGRIWWDEIVSTVVTSPEPHCQTILHPEQDRVLTIREVARIQGFPDYYRLFGPVKQRYTQVGNAVAIPVAKALGYVLGLAIQRKSSSSHMVELPSDFSTTSIAPSKENG
ncbi:DNA (cytosine-5)-methyltransferase CMT3 isoform X1 [Cryptomeria japonica]|uniref:DNA (cytosine-5)-methyltransferase CMT3 isoform X1 n=1 Tax=Cryptomeria japonica TaxID=3369 RepID=UPI0027DA2F54|nr:DNA (cytosine-5)-methyltransferase CMT3 isoform X1 [Cryptomeria japonica]